MPTEKPRVTFTISQERLSEVEAYRFDNKFKNQTQAILSLIEKGLSGLNKENPPSTTEAAPGERIISMEESNHLLEALGLIEEGQELTDDDLAFLTHIIGLLNAWFGKGK